MDAGPLVALVDADDQFHVKCVAALKALRELLVTVWPPVTEAMDSLGDSPKAQEALWEMLVRGFATPTDRSDRCSPNARADEQIRGPSDGPC